MDALETLEDNCVLSDDFWENPDAGMDCEPDRGDNAAAFHLAGPRAEIAFDPKECTAAIVTCGGLCRENLCQPCSSGALLVSGVASSAHSCGALLI